MAEGKCAIWGTEALVYSSFPNITIDSKRAGGKYTVHQVHEKELFNLSREEKILLTSELVRRRIIGNELPHIDPDEDIHGILRSYKRISTSERLRRFILYCSLYKNNLGQRIFERNYKASQRIISLDDNGDDLAYGYIECNDQSDAYPFIRYLYELSYLDSDHTLRYRAFEKIDELATRQKDTTQAFVAMWFHPDLDEAFENGIEPAVLEAGYEPRIIRKVEHNNKIDDEIIAEIRKSKFVIADFTCGFSADGKQAIARGGVYYEAGFAQGLGLPVIWTCRKDIIDHVHFDTRQYNHIVWETTEDLKEKLFNRIRATIT